MFPVLPFIFSYRDMCFLLFPLHFYLFLREEGEGEKEKGRRKREEGKGKKEKGRRKREEGKGKKEKGRRRKEEAEGKKKGKRRKEKVELHRNSHCLAYATGFVGVSLSQGQEAMVLVWGVGLGDFLGGCMTVLYSIDGRAFYIISWMLVVMRATVTPCYAYIC